MTPIEKAIREFCGHHADWWPSTTQVQAMLALVQQPKKIDMEKFVGSGKPVVFNDLTSLKHKQTVGPIESAMRERVLTDANGRKYITNEPFKPDYNTEAVLVEEMQRMAKRIQELEAMLERQTARIVELQEHIENFDGEDR